MGVFNKKILFLKRIDFTFLVGIANFSTREVYNIYWQFSLVDPWWLPKCDPEFGKEKKPLYGWLFFYFGRDTEGVVVPAAHGEEPAAKKPIYDRRGRLWHMYGFTNRQMAKDFRCMVKKFKTEVSVENVCGKYTVVNQIGRRKIFGI